MGACSSSTAAQMPDVPATIELRPKAAPTKAATSEYRVDASASAEPAPEPAKDDDDVVASPKHSKSKGSDSSITSRQLRSSTVRRMYGNLKKYATPVDEVFRRDISPDRFVTFNSYEYDELAPLQHEWWIDPTAIVDAAPIPSLTMVCEHALLDGQDVFIKRLNRNASSHKLSRSRRLLMAEVHIGANVHHPHIATFLGFCITPYSGLSCVTEFVPGTPLLDVLADQPFSWPEHKLAWALQIADALAYLHALGIAHRNVKPETVLISSKTNGVKLLGVGHGSIATFTTHHPPTTSEWSAPELLQGREVSDKADVYAFGLLLLTLDAQAAPFGDVSAHNYHEIMMKILTGTLKPTVPANHPLGKLMADCLQFSPTRRPPMAAVVAILQQCQQPTL
ncbi:serine/threonine protein kinase [Achlya hypogyna]|uniref:Serine/threonine protein kinase n=1 Tax=Achlya hypogyna TaxID=1202772 RepID=A0A1V9YA03_ACHHY|nr:serine/threonine protein kinase [Achlya hypogyna]